MAFAKLDSGIINSSIWEEPLATRVLWVTMLAMKDENGFVSAAKSGLRRAANISENDFEIAIKSLESKDDDSRTKDYDGKRIKSVEGGWIILNDDKYRMHSLKQKEQARERVKKYREKMNSEQKCNACNALQSVTERYSALPSVSVSVSESISESKDKDIYKDIDKDIYIGKDIYKDIDKNIYKDKDILYIERARVDKNLKHELSIDFKSVLKLFTSLYHDKHSAISPETSRALKRALEAHTAETIISGVKNFNSFLESVSEESIYRNLKAYNFLEKNCFLEDWSKKATEESKRCKNKIYTVDELRNM